MPYSIIHLEIAHKKSKELNLENKNFLDFLVGNLIVDSSYDLSELGVNIEREETHYHKGENYFEVDFPVNFLEKELKNTKNNYLKLGYYYHLQLDKFRRDNELKTIYNDDSIRNAYQIARKENAKKDLKNFIKKNNDLIEKLYNYEFNIEILPEIFKNIEKEKLKITFTNILDYMTLKNNFKKGEENENTKILIEKYFSYENHLKLKEKAFLEINLDIPYFFKI
ncbi:MAG: hypothetical protein PHR68_03430 [Candidatus Gracilibacteria bacterium]|nr:hypothetical protein [Candidatus Gracilibacteria bacterium]